MIFRKIIVSTMIMCMMFSVVACAKNEEPSAVKVTVNGQDITVGEYDKRLAQTMEIYEAENGPKIWDEEIEKGKTYKEYFEEMVLDSMILEIVILDEAKKENLEVTDKRVQKEFAKYKEYFTTEDDYNKFLKDNGMTEDFLLESIKREILVQECLSLKSKDINKLEPTDAELKAMYDEKPEFFNKIKASHILVETEKKAKDVKQKLDEGANFEDLAKEVSTCSSSEVGGDLGYFTYGDMMPEFSEVAFKMKIGEISEPVKSTYGYHIIKVTDIKNSYDDIERDELDYQYKAIKYNEMLDGFINNAKIKK